MHTFWFINISTHCAALRVPSLGLTNGSSFLAVKPLGALAKINCTTAATVYRLYNQSFNVYPENWFWGWPPWKKSGFSEPGFFQNFVLIYGINPVFDRVCKTKKFSTVWNWSWFEKAGYILKGYSLALVYQLLSGCSGQIKDLRSDNLQYNLLVRWDVGTNDSSTKHLMFQALFFS